MNEGRRAAPAVLLSTFTYRPLQLNGKAFDGLDFVGGEFGGQAAMIPAASPACRNRPDLWRGSPSQVASSMGRALAPTRTGVVHVSAEFWYSVDVPSNKPLKRMVGRRRPPTA